MNNNNDVKQIKEVIKTDHDGKFYEEKEIQEIINGIVTEVQKKNTTLTDDIITTTATQYLYTGKDGKYYFNIKRKQSKQKEYHTKILNTVKDNSVKLDIVSEKESIDLTSEELTKIEDQIKEQNEKQEVVQNEEYMYPFERPYKYKKPTGDSYGPYGSQWYHDCQVDDIWDDRANAFAKQFDILRAIKLPDQRTPEWYEMRNGKITASDGGTVLDVNSHEAQYKFILKKTTDVPFLSNKFVHHGKKYEDIATIIYEYRMNVSTSEFGLIGHSKHKFLGASPDRICNHYKLDGKHRSKYVGRMLEIKCPLVRSINTEGPIIDHICPIYYWVQVQLQLECCDLEECDFWQCEIREYESRQDFLEDTDPDEPYRSIETHFEKGCLIQLLPKDRMQDIIDGKYQNVVEDASMYIYPPRIEMSPYECDIWVTQSLADMTYNPKYKDYFFDKVLYWKLVKSKCVLINRDKQWFAEKLPKFEQVWNYVLYLRENKDKLKILLDFIESRKIKRNKEIMPVVDRLFNNKDIAGILKDIETGTNQKVEAVQYNDDDYMFIDTTSVSKPFSKAKSAPALSSQSSSNKFVKKPFFKKSQTKTDNDDGYGFI